MPARLEQGGFRKRWRLSIWSASWSSTSGGSCRCRDSNFCAARSCSNSSAGTATSCDTPTGITAARRRSAAHVISHRPSEFGDVPGPQESDGVGGGGKFDGPPRGCGLGCGMRLVAFQGGGQNVGGGAAGNGAPRGVTIGRTPSGRRCNPRVFGRVDMVVHFLNSGRSPS